MAYCRSSLSPLPVTDRMFCAGYPKGGKDTCTGDDGGPAAYNGIIFGVASWGLGCDFLSKPSAYAFVPAVSNWIQTLIN
ncbi:hypothetical protein DMENIID0001_056760 [Sergentomyia squamirostris]